MKLLVDTDAFCKLGVAEFLEDVAGIFNAGLHECGRLPALPYMLRKSRLRRVYGEATCDNLLSFAELMPVVPQSSITWLEKLTPIEAIDPGEAQIFAAAAEAGLIVISDDKRALRVLKNIEGFASALSGRIVVLDALFLSLCRQIGDEEVRRRVAPLVKLDMLVSVCFSSDNSNPREALLSYYRSITADSLPLILWDPGTEGEI